MTPRSPSFARRAVALAIGVALCALGGTARAEEEVRISILAGQEKVETGGKELAIFDGDAGERLAFWPTDGKATVTARHGVLEVTSGGKSYGRAARIIIEAKAGVYVGRGVYLGRMELSLEPGGERFLVVNRLPLETYLLGIVGSEMSPEWPLEALKAQAVAARTYAMQRHMMMRAANRPYDLESSVISQVYKGAEKIRPSVIQAVKETRGQVLAYEHALVEALFHSTCGGHTRSAKAAFGRAVPYLESRECRWCRDSSRMRWELSLPLAELSKQLAAAKLTRGRVERFERKTAEGAIEVQEAKKADGKTPGKVKTSAKAKARGKTKEAEKARDTRLPPPLNISPKAAREALGYAVLFSEQFTAKTEGRTVHIEGSGFGHGVGMCQWGARGMALEGKTHEEILEYYYEGAKLVEIY